jgi:transposase InsO family protein
MQTTYPFGVFSGIKRFMQYISDIAHLDKKVRTVIQRRIEIIEFFDEYGKETTRKAFKVGRSTIFNWKSNLKTSGGKLSSLAPISKAPKTRAKRVVKKEHTDFILGYRKEHPGVDKLTIKPVIDAVCLALGINTISESTIGRIIKELKVNNKIPNYQVKTTINGKTGNLRVKGTQKKEKKIRIGSFKPQKPGDLVQVDAITIFLDGIKRYIITALDVKTRFAFAYTYKTLSSNTAKDFIKRFREVSPFEIKAIQTDNGKEFHKYFKEYLETEKIIHYYNYPRCPKMNTFVERFNRTIQDQHISHNMHLLYDPNEANRKMMEYLIWYNTEKPHRGIGKVPPLQYFINNYTQPEESNMLWTATIL